MEDSMKKSVAASSGALVTSLIMTPLDVAKVRLQAQLPQQNKKTFTMVEKCVKQCACWNQLIAKNIEMSPQASGCQAFKKRTACMSLSTCARASMVTHSQFNSTTQALQYVFRTEGLSGLYSGLSPTLVIAIPSTVLYYTAYDYLLQRGKDQFPNAESIIPLVAGSSARVVAATIISPLELIRTRMMNENLGSGILQTYRMAIRSGGYSSLWNGLSATLVRDVPFSAIYWGCFETFKKELNTNEFGEKFTNVERAFFAGASAGAIAATITTPFDVVKTIQQVDLGSSSRSRRSRQSTVQVINRVLAHKGPKGLMIGVWARLAKVVPSCAIMISTYELGKEKLGLL